MSKAQNVETPSDRCRICHCNFRVKFGNISQPGKSRLFRQKTYSKSQKEVVILGQFSRIFAERLVWKLSRTRSFIRTVSATLARGKLGI